MLNLLAMSRTRSPNRISATNRSYLMKKRNGFQTLSRNDSQQPLLMTSTTTRSEVSVTLSRQCSIAELLRRASDDLRGDRVLIVVKPW